MPNQYHLAAAADLCSTVLRHPCGLTCLKLPARTVDSLHHVQVPPLLLCSGLSSAAPADAAAQPSGTPTAADSSHTGVNGFVMPPGQQPATPPESPPTTPAGRRGLNPSGLPPGSVPQSADRLFRNARSLSSQGAQQIDESEHQPHAFGGVRRQNATRCCVPGASSLQLSQDAGGTLTGCSWWLMKQERSP